MKYLEDIIHEADEAITAMLEDSDEGWQKLDTSEKWRQAGLDPRAWSGPTWIEQKHGYRMITKDGTRSLLYYGGFEYVDEEAITRVGRYTIWDGDYDSRVKGHVCQFNGEEWEDDE